MPYKSDAQRRYFNANKEKLEAEGVDVDHWNEESKGKDLPEKAKKDKKAADGRYGKLMGMDLGKAKRRKKQSSASTGSLSPTAVGEGDYSKLKIIPWCTFGPAAFEELDGRMNSQAKKLPCEKMQDVHNCEESDGKIPKESCSREQNWMEKLAISVERGGIPSQLLANTLGRIGALPSMLISPRAQVSPTGQLFGADPAREKKHREAAERMSAGAPDALSDPSWHTKLRLGGTDVIDDLVWRREDEQSGELPWWRQLGGRLMQNPRSGPLGKLYGLGLYPLWWLMANATRGSFYSPPTDVAHNYWDSPAVTEHELGHAIDFNERKLPKSWYGRLGAGTLRDLYTSLAHVWPANLYTESEANRHSLKALQKALRGDKKKLNERYDERDRVLSPAYGTYVGQPLGLHGVLAGVAGGHLVGRERVKQRQQARKAKMKETENDKKKKPDDEKKEKAAAAEQNWMALVKRAEEAEDVAEEGKEPFVPGPMQGKYLSSLMGFDAQLAAAREILRNRQQGKDKGFAGSLAHFNQPALEVARRSAANQSQNAATRWLSDLGLGGQVNIVDLLASTGGGPAVREKARRQWADSGADALRDQDAEPEESFEQVGPYRKLMAGGLAGKDYDIAHHRLQREQRPVNYWLNPFDHTGPLVELGDRMMRRQSAYASRPYSSKGVVGAIIANALGLGIPGLIGGGHEAQQRLRALAQQMQLYGAGEGKHVDDEYVDDAAASENEKQSSIRDVKAAADRLFKRAAPVPLSAKAPESTFNAQRPSMFGRAGPMLSQGDYSLPSNVTPQAMGTMMTPTPKPQPKLQPKPQPKPQNRFLDVMPSMRTMMTPTPKPQPRPASTLTARRFADTARDWLGRGYEALQGLRGTDPGELGAQVGQAIGQAANTATKPIGRAYDAVMSAADPYADSRYAEQLRYWDSINQGDVGAMHTRGAPITQGMKDRAQRMMQYYNSLENQGDQIASRTQAQQTAGEPVSDAASNFMARRQLAESGADPNAFNANRGQAAQGLLQQQLDAARAQMPTQVPTPSSPQAPNVTDLAETPSSGQPMDPRLAEIGKPRQPAAVY